MQSTRSSVPALSQTQLDAALLELARRVPAPSFAAEIRHLLRVAALAAEARSASLWLCADGQTLRCAARFHTASATWDDGAESRGAWPGTSSLAERRWATDHVARLSAEGGAGAVALDAGVWSGGALAGFIRLERGADRPWTDAEGAFAAALADRAGAARDASARAEAEAQLRARDAHVAELESIARVGSWDQDLSTNRITWSAQQCRLHGLEAGEGALDEAAFLAFIHPGDRAMVVDACARSIREAAALEIRYRVVRRDGATRWLAARGRAAYDADGRAVRLAGTSIDIHDRVLAEQAASASEARFRDLFEQFPDSVQVCAPDGSTLRVNAAYTRLWGRKLEDLAGMNLLRNPALEPVRDDLRRGFAGEAVQIPAVPVPAELAGPHAPPDVQWPRWIRASVFPIRDADGGLREVVLVHEDVTDERRAADELRARERQLAQTQEMVHLGSWQWDAAADRVTWSDELFRIFGTRPGEWDPTFANYLARVHGDDRERVAATVLGAVGGGGAFDMEERIVRPDGTVRVLRTVGEAVVAADGSVTGLVGACQDITEHTEAEQALRNSEESYRAIFESSNDAIFVHDLATGAVLDANARACELGGVTLDELRASGLSVIASGPPPFTAERAAEYLRVAATGQPQRFEWMTPHPETGEQMWVEVGLQRVTIRGEERLLALVRDIRERKAAEEAMRQSELSYRTLFQISSEAMWVHDLETGAFLEVNQAACDLYGYTEEETMALGVEGISWNEAPYTIDHAREYIRLAVAGEPQRFEWKGRRKDGTANWADMQLRRVTINGVDRLLANGRDISDRLRYEAELRRANEQLELRVAERTGELAAANEALEEEVAEHEAAKEALLERTHEVEGIFRALPDLFFRLGPDGTILDYRAGSHNKLAVPPEVFMWKRLQDVLPPVADATLAALDRAGRTNQLASFEYQLPTPAGMGDYEARVVPVPDGTFITVIRDVTDAKTAQRALQDSEERFRRMVANTYDIITVLEADGTVRYENDAMTRLLGYTGEERVGRSIADHIHPDDLPVVREALGRIVAAPGQAVTVEYRYRAKDGTLHYLESVGRTMSEHTAAEGVVANSRDVTESRAVQRALKESEEHFRTLIENSSDVATINDAVTGAVLYASPAAEVVLGWTPDELEGTTAADFVHPDDVHAVHEQMQELLLDPSQPQTMRYRHRRRDGGWMVLETTARIVVTPEGDYRMVANARDVTDRTRAEEALRGNEEHFRALIENAQDIVLILDANGMMTYLSPPIERILGWSPAELTDRSAFEYMHPEDQPIVAGELARVLAEPGLTGNAEYRFRDKHGRWRYMEAFGRVLETGATGTPSVVANVRDVTERHEAAEALRKSEEHFRALTENASDLITVLSAEGTYLYQSPSVLRLLGFTPADMLGVTPFGFMHPDDVEAARDSLRRMAGEPGTSHTVQIRFRHADGAWRVLESVGRTLLPDSADEGIVVISRDVTERRRTEEALRAATEAAERANRAKSEFLSRMSHELRTPMNSILGFAQLLGRAELPPNDQKSVQHILKAGRHLLNLINEVLEIARIEAGRHNLSLEPVRVTPLVEEALGLVRPMAAQWGVVLEHGPAPENAFVRADRQRLAQVILNLLSNAIKYNRPGGRVRLWCEPAADGRLVIRVEDEGRGIPAENAEQLFTPFARLGAESTGVEGTGLGLALSQRLTEAMGGALTLERSSAAGSVFRVELGGATDPLDALEGAEAGGSRGVPAGHGTATLLYVEDNLANLSLVETILLSRPGWRTLPALQGQIGVELAREHRPDLILLDLHLPDIPGEEVLRRLRADRRTAGIPIIVISADATRATAERLRALGADAYLSKPIDVDEFLETVERFLAAREGL